MFKITLLPTTISFLHGFLFLARHHFTTLSSIFFQAKSSHLFTTFLCKIPPTQVVTKPFNEIKAIEINVGIEEPNHLDQQRVPLLKDASAPKPEQKTLIQRKSNMTAGLVALCGISCFVLCFTDRFRDAEGNVCYGMATFHGLWVIDGSATISPDMATGYLLKFIGFVHTTISILVFSAVALFYQNVVNCLYPTPSEETKELLTTLSVGIGVICSMFSRLANGTSSTWFYASNNVHNLQEGDGKC